MTTIIAQRNRRKIIASLVILVLAALFIFLALLPIKASSAHALPLQPQRVHCGALRVPVSGVQPCKQGMLLDWHGTPLAPSQSIATPLKWSLSVLCTSGKSVEVSVIDAQMTISTESFVCDNKWHGVQYYPLEDNVFFRVSGVAEVQVWTA